MTLIEALRGSIYIEECAKAFREAKDVAALKIARSILDLPDFRALPENDQAHLLMLYSERWFQLNGAFV